MKHFTTPNGNLVLQSEPADEPLLSDLLSRHGHNETEFLDGLLEATGWTANGRLYLVNPQDVGALTDAPILSDELRYGEHGDLDSVGSIWWYPDYAVSNLAEQLVRKGQVLLHRAP